MLGLGRTDVLLGQRRHFAERQREVERRVIDGAEIRVRARRVGALVGHDREVDLLGIGSSQYFRMTPTTTPCTCT